MLNAKQRPSILSSPSGNTITPICYNESIQSTDEQSRSPAVDQSEMEPTCFVLSPTCRTPISPLGLPPNSGVCPVLVSTLGICISCPLLHYPHYYGNTRPEVGFTLPVIRTDYTTEYSVLMATIMRTPRRWGQQCILEGLPARQRPTYP